MISSPESFFEEAYGDDTIYIRHSEPSVCSGCNIDLEYLGDNGGLNIYRCPQCCLVYGRYDGGSARCR